MPEKSTAGRERASKSIDSRVSRGEREEGGMSDGREEREEEEQRRKWQKEQKDRDDDLDRDWEKEGDRERRDSRPRDVG
jgi:hypothetical protein